MNRCFSDFRAFFCRVSGRRGRRRGSGDVRRRACLCSRFLRGYVVSTGAATGLPRFRKVLGAPGGVTACISRKRVPVVRASGVSASLSVIPDLGGCRQKNGRRSGSAPAEACRWLLADDGAREAAVGGRGFRAFRASRGAAGEARSARRTAAVPVLRCHSAFGQASAGRGDAGLRTAPSSVPG